MTEATETRVLDAAEQLFAERGYAATTTRSIAERAGVNEVTLFRLFGNKLGLLMAVFRRAGVEQLRQDADAGEVPEDPVRALTALARREVEASMRHGALAIRIAFEARTVPEIAEIMGEGPEGNLRLAASLFERWQEAGAVRRDIDPRLMAEAFFSLTSSVVMYRHVMGLRFAEDIPGEEIARQLAEVFLGGVLTKEEI